MALKWKDGQTEHTEFADVDVAGVDVAVYSDKETREGSIDLATGGNVHLHAAFTGDLARGKALAESLAAWWTENKPMGKGA